jgi:acetyltransferase-like isoleucine patch superfamily enzyme
LSENLFFDKAKLKHCGNNVIIGKTVRIRSPEKVSIGDNVIIDDFTYISGELDVGDFVHIAAGCVLSASESKISMAAFSCLAAGCKVYAGSSNYVNCGLDTATIPKAHQYNVIYESVHLEAFALIGASGIILPGCRIPEGTAVAAAITVRKSLALKRWHVLLDDFGKQIKRRGVSELKARVNAFYKIEIGNQDE